MKRPRSVSRIKIQQRTLSLHGADVSSQGIKDTLMVNTYLLTLKKSFNK
jgi:hypothetical protein